MAIVNGVLFAVLRPLARMVHSHFNLRGGRTFPTTFISSIATFFFGAVFSALIMTVLY